MSVCIFAGEFRINHEFHKKITINNQGSTWQNSSQQRVKAHSPEGFALQASKARNRLGEDLAGKAQRDYLKSVFAYLKLMCVVSGKVFQTDHCERSKSLYASPKFQLYQK